jgi:dephospho-CoA kinase
MMRRRPIIIGITGGIGTGKSTVAAAFKRLGARVLDADKIAHAAMRKGKKTYKRIVKEFGKGMLNDHGEIARRRLGYIIFRHRKLYDRLCAIIHPEVIEYSKRYIRKVARSPRRSVVVIDAPLLIEAGMDSMLDALIVVKASLKTQIRRTQKKSALNRAEIKRRIKNQIPLKDKLKLADYVIYNEGSKEDMRKMVNKIWKEIKSGRE